MGLFDKNKKNKDKENEEEVEALGWDAITEAFDKVYPGQDNPKHYGTLVSWRLGGPDPIDGISIYDGGDYWHFVTYGLSDLYEKETDDPEWSGYGMEFTMRLKKGCYNPEDEEDEIKCVIGNLQNIAKITFNSGELFLPWEWIYTGQKNGIDLNHASKLTGFITVPDTLVPPIETPFGKVEFVEFVGAADAELLKIQSKETTVRELFEKLGSDITDYKRESIF
ncbi:MAG: suppressor of fused domain protein [Oscillospiraceae bacterium]|nr:suppressor of fused domain protein [Oscillospiraceae bacterium]